MKRSGQKLKDKRQNLNIDIAIALRKITRKELSISEAAKKYDVPYSILNEKLDKFKNFDADEVFTKEQERALKEHITKCCKTQYGVTNTTIRRIIYEYAKKLPDCKPPSKWHDEKMAAVNWFINFRSRHPTLKKILSKKYEHQCVCIMGCHMGPEGKQALKKLEAKVVIARVYHYLNKEYEYMKMCNDLGLLVNVLRRTAEATGVCEQTITNILEEEKKTVFGLHEKTPAIPKAAKKQNPVELDHSYINGVESANAETIDEDSSSASSNNVQCSTDFERLQQDATLIKSVKVEILDDDIDEKDDVPIAEDVTMRDPLELSTEPAPSELQKLLVAKDSMEISSTNIELSKDTVYQVEVTPPGSMRLGARMEYQETPRGTHGKYVERVEAQLPRESYLNNETAAAKEDTTYNHTPISSAKVEASKNNETAAAKEDTTCNHTPISSTKVEASKNNDNETVATKEDTTYSNTPISSTIVEPDKDDPLSDDEDRPLTIDLKEESTSPFELTSLRFEDDAPFTSKEHSKDGFVDDLKALDEKKLCSIAVNDNMTL